jgi:hypothetical protein
MKACSIEKEQYARKFKMEAGERLKGAFTGAIAHCDYALRFGS